MRKSVPKAEDELEAEPTGEEAGEEAGSAEAEAAEADAAEWVGADVHVHAGRKGTAADRDAAGASDAAALQDELEELSDRHLRLAAEFNNFRRRTEQERLSAWSRAQADVVARFLDVLDDLQRVAHLDASSATVETIMEGIDLVERKFVRTLGDAAVEVLDPLGEPFDPEVMEAMMRVPAESEDQDETVAQVFQKGYSLKGVLIRPARVSVFVRG